MENINKKIDKFWWVDKPEGRKYLWEGWRLGLYRFNIQWSALWNWKRRLIYFTVRKNNG